MNANQQLKEALRVAIEERTEEAMEDLFAALRAWKRANPATISMARAPKRTRSRQNSNPVADIFHYLGMAATEGDWSGLIKIYERWG